MPGQKQSMEALEAYNPWLTPRKKMVAGGIVLLLSLAAVISVVAIYTGQEFMDVNELQQKGSLIFGKPIKISGLVVPGSILPGPEEGVRFQVVDAKIKGGTPLEVVFAGVPPGQFSVPSVEVVLEGSLQPDNDFHATSIITRESRQYIPVAD